jgi:predicted ATPase/DNA-binding SARP family transcriptional activator
MISPGASREPAPEPADVIALRLHDLGPLTALIAGVQTPIRGAKSQRILTTLLVNANRRVSVDTLIDAVWGDQATAGASGTLESHVWRLRKAIEPPRGRGQEPTYLVNDSGGYRLLVSPDNADSLWFVQLAEQGDRLMATGDVDRARRRFDLALSLWRGRPFDAVADEEWAAAPIARLEERHGQVHENRIEALLRQGDRRSAIGDLEALINQLPYREHLWVQLMTALYQDGRVEESLATYRRARETLLDTLGIEPGRALTELHQRVLAQDESLAPPPAPAVIAARPTPPATADLSTAPAQADPADPSAPPVPAAAARAVIQLPSRLSTLIGREAELTRVGRLLERSRLVTVAGPAGAGKTRLAIDVARKAATLAADGVWFIDLAAVDTSASIVDVVLSTIGVEPAAIGTSLSALRSYVRDHELLLLIDNCEHLLPAVYRLVDALLADEGSARILATSREPIGIDGEVVWTLAPLPVRETSGEWMPDDSPRGELSPAARLFLSRAESVDAAFDPTGRELADIEAICAAVDGLPLAIELAAGRIRSASLGEVLRQVRTELAGLSRIGLVPTAHHRTVEASIDWSVQLLSDEEQLLHARLSVLPGSFTAEAARAVAAGAPIRPLDVDQLLTQLVHRSLLTAQPGDDATNHPTTFRQLSTVRAHASHALTQLGEDDAATHRRTAFILALIDDRPPFWEEDRHGWYAAVDHNHDTLAAVLQHTIEARPDPAALHVLTELGLYWMFHRRLSEGTRWMEAALERTGDNEPARGGVEITLASMFALRDRTDRAVPLVRSALTHFDAFDVRIRVMAFTGTAWSAWLRGETGLDFLDEEVHRLVGDDPLAAAWSELLVARSRLASDGPLIVGGVLDELIERARQLGNLHAAWLSGWSAVVCALLCEDAELGLARLHQVADFQRRLGGTLTANIVECQADFTSLAGDHEAAAGLFGQASALAFRAGHPWPMIRQSSPVLDRVRHSLPTAVYEQAWTAGDALARTDR